MQTVSQPIYTTPALEPYYGVEAPKPVHTDKNLLTDDDLGRIVLVVQGYNLDTGYQYRPSLGRASKYLQEYFLGVWNDWHSFVDAKALVSDRRRS